MVRDVEDVSAVPKSSGLMANNTTRYTRFATRYRRPSPRSLSHLQAPVRYGLPMIMGGIFSSANLGEGVGGEDASGSLRGSAPRSYCSGGYCSYLIGASRGEMVAVCVGYPRLITRYTEKKNKKQHFALPTLNKTKQNLKTEPKPT